MDPIPAWVRKLWDIWDLRMLVLLSFILQVILSVFGNRRKYISALWINVLVWSAYLVADWVATVALGKLSDAQGDNENGNALWAIWAPLLLLHLGGPDTITAYSLEDNQLWMRHVLTLVVQLFVAIYVVLMSWKSSWFSFMSFPTLIAGIIKYGERTWVLKSVAEDESGDVIPLENIGNYNLVGDDEDVFALYMAHKYVKDFMGFVETNDLSFRTRNIWGDLNKTWNVVEVEMGLMFDSLYTKATIIYSKRGCILRCISFTATLIVSLGLIFRLVFKAKDRGKWDDVDIAITWVLLIGALALEIYAVVGLVSSDWAMLWLIKHGKREHAMKLRQLFSWLFSKSTKRWSKTMGQFNLVGFLVEDINRDHQKPSRKVVRSVLGSKYEDKLNRYLFKTTVDVHPRIYNEVLEFWTSPHIGNLPPNSAAAKVRRFLMEDFSLDEIFINRILCAHFATEMCYRLETEWDGGGNEPSTSDPDPACSLWKQDRQISKNLSDYMMYLVIMRPRLLPNAVQDSPVLKRALDDPKKLIGGALDVNEACRYLLETKLGAWSEAVNCLKGEGKAERWKILKLVWVRIICYATGKGEKNEHLQQLRQGGELVTLLWLSSGI